MFFTGKAYVDIAKLKAQNIWFIQKLPTSCVGLRWPSILTLFIRKYICLHNEKLSYHFGDETGAEQQYKLRTMSRWVLEINDFNDFSMIWFWRKNVFVNRVLSLHEIKYCKHHLPLLLCTCGRPRPTSSFPISVTTGGIYSKFFEFGI